MLEKFSENIWYMRGEERTDRPYLYYIKGSRLSAAVDAGNSAAHIDKFYGALRDEGLPLPDITFITHWHWDHTFAMHKVHGLTVSSAGTDKKLREVMRWQWTDEAMQARVSSGEDVAHVCRTIKIEYPDLDAITVVPPDIAVSGTVSADLGGITCLLSARDSTHSRDALFIYVPEEKTLIAGDALCADYYDNGGRYDRVRLLDMISYIEGTGARHILDGHGEPDTAEEWLSYLRGLIDGTV